MTTGAAVEPARVGGWGPGGARVPGVRVPGSGALGRAVLGPAVLGPRVLGPAVPEGGGPVVGPARANGAVTSATRMEHARSADWQRCRSGRSAGAIDADDGSAGVPVAPGRCRDRSGQAAVPFRNERTSTPTASGRSR
jgi:hypothetical protein